MSRIGNGRGRFACLLVVGLIGAFSGGAAVGLDRVVLRDGTELEGRLVSVDEAVAIVDVEGGGREHVDRDRLARIEFGEAAPALSARVKVYEADDEVTLYLDGIPLAAPADLAGGWIDLAPLLQEGPNLLTGEVFNDGGTWAYRWVLEVDARKYRFTCGLAHKSGCRRGGLSERARGEMPAGRAWLFVDRRSGDIEVQVEEE
jgi:hypothetical protein